VVFEHGDINRHRHRRAVEQKAEPFRGQPSLQDTTNSSSRAPCHRIIFADRKGSYKITIVDKTKKNKSSSIQPAD